MAKAFSNNLQSKIDQLKTLRKATQLGSIQFASPLILAPMASICNAPFRLLMEDLGAGGTVSELISCHGINYNNHKTLEMLYVHPNEKNVGIQLFGEDGKAMGEAAKVAEQRGIKFIDINMGCPVRKVVTKGGGSALLRDVPSLAPFFRNVKSAIKLPLTIKIRMGWDSDEINADKIIQLAKNEGIEFVAIHGRTRAQQYTGLANWDYIESLASHSPLPLIGNGDLHQAHQVQERLKITKCPSLMIGRGALRNPFIFLEGLIEEPTRKSQFDGPDYWEVIERLADYTYAAFEHERTRIVQLRKLIMWFAAGFPGAAKFRTILFKIQSLDELMLETHKYFSELKAQEKFINYDEVFMSSGHG